MKPATRNQIGRTCAMAIVAAVALTGATVMFLATAHAEGAKDVVLEGRAAKTDRLDISNVKPEILREQKSEPLPLPTTAQTEPEPTKKEARVSSDQGDEKGTTASDVSANADAEPNAVAIEPGAGTEETQRNFADRRVSKPRWQISKESVDRFGRRVSYIWQLITDTK